MNERILSLLSLCMQAIDLGFNVKQETFKCVSGKKAINLWHYGHDNGKLFLIKYTGDIDEAEAYLKGLIA